MKTILLSLTLLLATLSISSQVFADLDFSSINAGTGTFNNGVLSDFIWTAEGTINGYVQIRMGEVFDDGNKFEDTFGQANLEDNLRIQVYPNGSGTEGETILSKAKLNILFEEITPDEGWGFCILDIDVENCLISGINENDDTVTVSEINSWLIELFDANTVDEGLNVPKWDSTHAAILGFNTPEEYTVYNNLVLEGMQDSETPSAFFMPDIPLKELIIYYENLQSSAYTSFHFFIASMRSTDIYEVDNRTFDVFPNPASSVLCIQLPVFSRQSTVSSPQIIQIFDLNGRVLIEKPIPPGVETLEMDVSQLNNGIYFCKIWFGDACMTKKIIIQK